MPTHVSYEWTAEEIDEDGDLVNVQFGRTLAEAREMAATPITDCERIDVGLVRREGNQEDGETARYYAYVRDDGTLPELFSTCSNEEDGPRVPARFHIEAAQFAQQPA